MKGKNSVLQVQYEFAVPSSCLNACDDIVTSSDEPVWGCFRFTCSLQLKIQKLMQLLFMTIEPTNNKIFY